MIKVGRFVLIITLVSSVLTALGILSSKICYRLGYCKAFDERSGAYECKPSRKWL